MGHDRGTTVCVRDLDKTHFIQFTTKYSPHIDFDISYTIKLIAKAYNTKFLGIYISRENAILENSC